MPLLRLLRREDGISLVMAIGILAVLSLSGSSVVYYSAANTRSAEYSKDNTGSYVVAEAGINEATSVLFNPENNPMNPFLLPAADNAQTSSYDGRNVTWSGSFDEASTTWTLTSTGSTTNPTGPGTTDVKRTLTAKVRVVPNVTDPLANPVWNYVYVYGTGDPRGCDYSQDNNSAMGSPLYVAGNACFDNQARVTGGPLQIHGTLTFNNVQNMVGSTTQPVKTVNIKGGCKLKPATTFHLPCDRSDQVYSNPSPAGTNPITLSTPAPAWEAWYLNASPGPYYACTTTAGTAPNGNWATLFDNDQGAATSATTASLNRSIASTVALTPSSSYSCKTYAGGELSWNATSTASDVYGPAKTLTVNGTVFIDGNARIDSGSVVTYRGQGSLYLSGSFVLKNTQLCAVASGSTCDWALGDGHWDPNKRFLNIVAGYKGGGGQNDANSSDISIELRSIGYQGGMLAHERINVGSSSSTMGPIVSRKLTVAQSITTYPFPLLTEVPVAMAGNPVAFATPLPPTNYGG